MDPRDRPAPLTDGATCTACGASVPRSGIRILARRDDLAFVELACPACGSATLGLLVPPNVPDGEAILDVAGDAPAGANAAGNGTFRPISEADVAVIREDLDAWQGDLVGWLDSLSDGDRPNGDRRGSVVDR
jgi:hypothetical protein